MSKRRMFDIDFPTDEAPAVPAGTESAQSEPADRGDARRGPMATAISENASALRSRAEAEQAIRAENDRLAHEFVRLKKLGLVVDRIPLDQIATGKLTRDRALGRDPELDELKDSIRSIGLSNPIRVEQTDEGYELVQGFRRLSAYRSLLEETGDAEFATIPAGLIARGETLEGLYRRMVDENLVRRDISFAEMAQLALSYWQDPQTSAGSLEEAVNSLYASAGRQKRIYVRNFAELLELTDGQLQFPEALPRKLGLDLRRALVEDPGASAAVVELLRAGSFGTPEAENLALTKWLESYTSAQPAPTPARSERPANVATRGGGSAKTTLRCLVPAGVVRCQARDGRIEMAMDRDFSAVDQRLEAAIQAFFTALED